MVIQIRNQVGQFDLKGEEPRLVRSLRLTDTCWEALGEVAENRGISRADLLERMVEDGYLDEYELYENSGKQDLLEAIREVLDSLEPGEEPLIEVPDHRHKAPYRRALKALLKYLENI